MKNNHVKLSLTPFERHAASVVYCRVMRMGKDNTSILHELRQHLDYEFYRYYKFVPGVTRAHRKILNVPSREQSCDPGVTQLEAYCLFFLLDGVLAHKSKRDIWINVFLRSPRMRKDIRNARRKVAESLTFTQYWHRVKHVIPNLMPPTKA